MPTFDSEYIFSFIYHTRDGARGGSGTPAASSDAERRRDDRVARHRDRHAKRDATIARHLEESCRTRRSTCRSTTRRWPAAMRPRIDIPSTSNNPTQHTASRARCAELVDGRSARGALALARRPGSCASDDRMVRQSDARLHPALAVQALVVMLAVAFIAFSMFRFVGDPVANMLGQEATRCRPRGAAPSGSASTTRSASSSPASSATRRTAISASPTARQPVLVADRRAACRRRSSSRSLAAIFAFVVGVALGVYAAHPARRLARRMSSCRSRWSASRCRPS